VRYLTLLLGLLGTVAALGYTDPFLPELPLGAGPDAVCGAMGELGWEIEHRAVNPDGRTVIRAGNPQGWLLYYEYTSDGEPFSALTAEVWTEEGQRDASHDAWKERLSAQFGEPETTGSAYGDLLRWPSDYCTIELDTHAPEFYIEGYHTLVVLVLFPEAGGGD
jgi:hypothetical protein